MARIQTSLKLGVKLPADVGNAHAAKTPSQPVTGDTLTVRFNSEPKVLNTITESSAVQKYIVTKNVTRRDWRARIWKRSDSNPSSLRSGKWKIRSSCHPTFPATNDDSPWKVE